MVERRTYKVGLRAPASLVSGLARLVEEREVLRYLEDEPGGDLAGFCRRKAGLDRAPATTRARYGELVGRWRGRDLAAIAAALGVNAAAIGDRKGQDPSLHAPSFPRAAIAAASATASPDPADISLHDYCWLAGESLKMTCAHLDSIAREVSPLLPGGLDDLVAGAMANAAARGRAITEASLRAYPEKAIAHYLDRHGNVELTAFEQVAAMMAVHRDACDKVDHARALLFGEGDGNGDGDPPSLAGAVPALLYTASVPRHVRNYLAKAWHVDPGWVRNTVTGWRRKLDGFLPPACQVEPLGALFAKLADHARSLVPGDGDAARAVASLEKQRVLHLLHEPRADLAPLVEAGLRDACRRLQEHARAAPGALPPALQDELARRESRIPVDAARQAATTLSASVEDTMARFPAGSTPARNCEVFIKKIDAVAASLDAISPFLDHHLPGTRYAGAVARALAALPGTGNERPRRLFTAARGTIALAFATLHPEATARFEGALVPGRCVTRPYTSSKRTRKHLPINLLFNKYVVIRKAHPAATREVDGKEKEAYLDNDGATALLREGKPVWLGIPIFSPDQFDRETRRLSGTRKGVFWFELVPGAPVMERLRRGARLEAIRLEVPRGPARKVVADLVLAADGPAAFSRSGKFLAAMDRTCAATPIPRDDFIGSDLNALGPHAIALGTSGSTVDLAAGGGGIVAPLERAGHRVAALRGEIARLQRAIDRGGGDTGRQGRRRGQLGLLHRKLRSVREDAERRVLMAYLYGLHRTGATHASWDAVELSTRGTTGALAVAITTMPKRAGLLAEFQAWAGDLVSAALLPRFKAVITVSPYTGQVCDECTARTGELKKTRRKGTPYHEFECVACGKKGNRHQVSARVAALLLKRHVDGRDAAVAS